MTVNALSEVASPGLQPGVLKSELEYMAYHGQYTAVYERYLTIPEQDRVLYENVEILSGVVLGCIKQVQEFRHGSDLTRARSSPHGKFVEHVLNQLIAYCTSRKTSPRELFICIFEWAGELARMALSDDALRYFDKAEALEIRRYPDLYAMLMSKRAELLFNAGRHEDAHRILSELAENYYLVPDRNLFSSIIFMLGKTALLNGQARSYKELLFSGLRYFYTRDDIRLLFTEQLIKTYRHFYRVFFDHDRPLSEKLLFLIHWFYHSCSRHRMSIMTAATKAARMIVLGYVYFLNYGHPRGAGSRFLSGWNECNDKRAYDPCRPDATKKSILVTRAMGGIGDLLMMTPGFHALKEAYPDNDIFLAAPRQYHQLFIGNDDVKLIDIEKASLEARAFGKWFNFTDCPAGRIESRTAPDVKMNRIDIFARALGIRGTRLRKMDRRPRYFLTGGKRNSRPCSGNGTLP